MQNILIWNGVELTPICADACEGMAMLGSQFGHRGHIISKFIDEPLWTRMYMTWALMLAGF